MKEKYPQVFTQGISVQNFSQIRPSLKPAPKFLDIHTYNTDNLDPSSTEVENT